MTIKFEIKDVEIRGTASSGYTRELVEDRLERLRAMQARDEDVTREIKYLEELLERDYA